MKSFFKRKITPPDMVTRAKLLKKLTLLRGDKRPELAEIKRQLKARIRATEGNVTYLRFHKGVEVELGDQNTPKKNLLAYRHANVMSMALQKKRHENKRTRVQYKEYNIERASIVYEKLGGVLTQENVFGQANRKVRRQRVYKLKTPQRHDLDFHIGIEIEFASKKTIEDLADTVADMGLQQTVRVMRDGSIQVDKEFPYQVEVCILTKFSDLDKTLKAVECIINPETFRVNPSCGLHVHLDARNVEHVKQMYKNLVSAQSVLFGMADESRRENRYCHAVPDVPFDQSNAQDHYAAVSSSSYYKHRTIEVRMHHAILDMGAVGKWVKLLKKIADYKGEKALQIGTFETELNQLKENVQIEPELVEFIHQRVGA